MDNVVTLNLSGSVAKARKKKTEDIKTRERLNSSHYGCLNAVELDEYVSFTVILR